MHWPDRNLKTSMKLKTIVKLWLDSTNRSVRAAVAQEVKVADA